jgi:hypothetical protein
MLGNGHVRFGGRVRETDRAQARHRALTRPNNELRHRGLRDILICCVDGLRAPAPRPQRHPHLLRRWAERLPGGDRDAPIMLAVKSCACPQKSFSSDPGGAAR